MEKCLHLIAGMEMLIEYWTWFSNNVEELVELARIIIPFALKDRNLINSGSLLPLSYVSTRYGAMILEALSELNEPNGSEVTAIQGFIEVDIS